MERDALHLAADVLHQNGGPVVVVVAGTRGDAIEVVVALIAQVGVELTVLVRVVLGTHVSTAAPGLVTDTEVLHLPGLAASVGTAQTGHRGVAVASHVLYPLGHLLHGTRTNVTADIRLAAQHLAEVQELVGTERVVLDGAAPVVVTQRGTILLGTDTIHPVVVVGKAAAGPAEYGNLQGFQGLEHILTVAVDVRDLGVFAHPETAVDTAAQVLGELSVDLAINLGSSLVGMNRSFHIFSGRCRYGKSQCDSRGK